MLPNLISNAYPLKSKKRTDVFIQTKKVDVDKQVRPKSFVQPPQSASSGFRTTSTNQSAARYQQPQNGLIALNMNNSFSKLALSDKKAISEKIEAKQRSMGNTNQANHRGGSEGVQFGRSNQNNIVVPSNNMNFKIVTDNISRNVLIYAPKTDGREKFQQGTQYPESLKQIDRKIQRYKRALEEAIRNQQEALTKDPNFFEDHEEIIVAQEENEQDPEQNFDFMTGIGLVKQDEEVEEQEQEEKVEEQKEEQQPAEQPQIIRPQLLQPKEEIPHQFEEVRKAFSQIYQSYQNQISKAFIKKDQPKARVKRKNPKINITSKGNTVAKTGAPFDEVEHLMRVYNKEHIPCHPRILVPSFQQKKDNIANSVLAYLKDYRPLLSGNKANIPKSIQGLLEVELEMLKQSSDQINNTTSSATEQNQRARQQMQQLQMNGGIIHEEDNLSVGESSSKLFQPIQPSLSGNMKASSFRRQTFDSINQIGSLSGVGIGGIDGSSADMNFSNTNNINNASTELKKDVSAIQQQQYVFPSSLGKS